MIFKIFYFSASALIFLLLCAPNFKKFRNGKSLFANLLEMQKNGVKGSFLVMGAFVNLIASVLLFVFKSE